MSLNISEKFKDKLDKLLLPWGRFNVWRKDKWYNFKYFFVNIWRFRTTLKEFRDWDFHYNLHWFADSLIISGRSIKKYDTLMRSQRTGNEMIFVGKQLKKWYDYSAVIDDTATSYYYDKVSMRHEKIENGPSAGNYSIHFDYDTDNKPRLQKLMEISRKRTDKMQRDHKKKLFDIIAKKGDCWWN